MKHLLAQLASGTPLTAAQAVEAFDLVMTGRATPAQVGALLALLALRGPTEDELVGAATVMRAQALPVPLPQFPGGLTVLDTCGTGGGGAGTFNISTSAGLIVAAVGRTRGVVVAKHGNRGVTSRSGSSQVLEELGVKIQVSPATLTRCLAEIGFCFCYAPAHHPAMKYAAAVRADLGFRTLFNLVGPLTNPAGATHQVLGVYDPALTGPIARVLGRLGSRSVMVVHGRMSWSPGAAPTAAGLCELTTTGPTQISHLHQGIVTTSQLDARTLGLSPADPADLSAADPAASARIVRAVLAGAKGAPRDIVRLNAAAALVVTGLAADLPAGLALAAETLDSGAARAVLESLIRITAEA
jgi:anthranilate phosphoribosyltransferase